MVNKLLYHWAQETNVSSFRRNYHRTAVRNLGTDGKNRNRRKKSEPTEKIGTTRKNPEVPKEFLELHFPQKARFLSSKKIYLFGPF